MPLPIITPDGTSGGPTIKTGRTGSFSYSFDFTITSRAPVFNSTNTGIPGNIQEGFALYMSGDNLNIFKGIAIRYASYIPFTYTLPSDAHFGYNGQYGGGDPSDPLTHNFDLGDNSTSYPPTHYFDITGSVSVTVGPWEEWKTPQPNDTLDIGIYFNSSALWTVNVTINNPYATGAQIAMNHLSLSGSVSNLTGDGYSDAGLFKQYLLGDNYIGVSACQPDGSVTVSNLKFEDGHGTGPFTFSTVDRNAALTVSDTTLTISRTGYTSPVAASFSMWPYTYMNADGLITKQFDTSFGSNVVLNTSFPQGNITAPGGVLSGAIDVTQRIINLNGVRVYTNVPALGNYTAYKQSTSLALDGAWANANGIAGDFIRAEYNGKIYLYDDVCWPITTLTHAASSPVDTFAPVTGWAGAGVTVATAGGMKLTASTGGRSVSKTFDIDLRNYRFLRVNLACDAGSVGLAFVFTIGGKIYTVKPTQTAAKDYDIDLCAPDSVVNSGLSVLDQTDGAWPPQGQVTGCEQVGTLSIQMPSGTTVATIAALNAVRKGATLPGWILPEQMPAFVTGEAYHSDALPGLNTWRFLRAKLMGAVVDGKPCCDLYYAQRYYFNTYTGSYWDTTNGIERYPVNELLSINNWMTEVNSSRQLGLHATPPAEIVSTGLAGPVHYYNAKLYAEFLTLDSIGARAAWGSDFSSVVVNAWPVYGTINFYPGYTGGYHLRFTKRVWGSVIGTLVGPSAAGQTVSISSALGPPETQTADTNGFFKSGPRATHDITQAVTVRNVTASVRAIDSSYKWAGFFPVPLGDKNPSNDHHYLWGDYLRVGTFTGNVMFSLSNASVPIGGFDTSKVMVTSSGQDSDPRAVYDRTGAGRIVCVFCRTSGGTSNVYQTISTDDGATWGTPVIVIASGRHPCPPSFDNDGVMIIAGVVGAVGGPCTISAKVQAPGDVSLSTAFTLKDQTGANLSVNDDTFGISMGKDSANRWIMAVCITGDTGISEWYSADWDARTWTRVV